MRRRVLLGFVAIAALPAHSTVLKVATIAPEGSVWHRALATIADDWKRISSGAIEVRIYPGGVAGDDEAMVAKMRIGQLSGAALTADGMASIATEMRIFQTPMLIDDDAELDHLRARLGPELESLARAQGFEIVAWCDVGWIYLFSKAPVADPDAARRNRIQVSPGDTGWATALTSAGYKPLVLPTTEILTGLQSGMIDAFAVPPVVALSSQWFGVAKHMLDLKWSPMLGAVVVSEQAWQQLPADETAALQASARRATAAAQAEVRRFEHDAIVAMQSHGLTVHEVSADDTRRFEDEIRASYAKLVGASVPAPIFKEANEVLDEYRRAH